MDYIHLGLLSALITSPNKGLENKEVAQTVPKAFYGKTILAWLQQNWPDVSTKADAEAVAQILVTKSVLTGVTADDRQFNEKNLYTFGVNPNNDLLVEQDIVERTPEELVDLTQKYLKKQFSGVNVIAWLIKEFHVSRNHALQVANQLLQLGLVTHAGASSTTPDGFQPSESVNYVVNGHVLHLPVPDDISKVYELDHVPTIISNDCKMDGVRLVYKGYLVAKYHRSPYLLVSHVTEDQVSICAPPKAPAPVHIHSPSSPASAAHNSNGTILHWVSHKSIVFALLSDGTLEGVDVESKQTQEYPATTHSLAGSVLGLLADDTTVIGLITNGLIIWERSSTRPPKMVNLSLTVNVPLAPDFCSLLPDNQILLVYTNQKTAADPVFTLWCIKDILAGKVSLLIKGTITEAYGSITCVANHKDRLIFAGEKSKLMCWIRPSGDETPPSPTASAPFFLKPAPKDAKATTLFIDNWFLLVGDTSGTVTLHNRKSGERIYALNAPCGTPVHKIVRVGRWIFCAYDLKLAVYDIYRSDHPSPIQLYTSSANLPIRDFQVNPGAITLLLGGPASKSSSPLPVGLRTSHSLGGGSATSLANRVGRTKVAVWAPRLDALDVYLKKPSLAQSHPILPALIYTYRRIVDILGKCVHEDVAEYRATLEWMRLTIDWIIKSSHERKDDDVMGIGGVPFLVLRALQLSGDKYCAALVRICPAGSDPKHVFSRILSSSRRRAELDRLNASMYAALSEAVTAVGSGWQHINAAEPPFIDDAEGCAMWKAGFGASCLMAEWSRFFEILRLHQTPAATFDSTHEAILRYILDPSGTHHVSQHRFGAFLRGFGPLSQCISKTLLITNPSWFVGYLSRVEGEILLQTQVPGTFMIRLSRSAHAFTISVMHSDGKVHHIVVDPRPTPPSSPSSETASPQQSPVSTPSPTASHLPNPVLPHTPPVTPRSRVFTVLEAVGPERYFNSLVELIQNYPHALRMPYNDPLHCMPWFQGDITSEEATHMLAQAAPGTFLVHLCNNSSAAPPQSPGSLTPFKLQASGIFNAIMWVCSVMGTDHTVYHLYIIQHVEGYSLATHTSTFPTLPALIKHYAPYGLMRPVETSCKTLPKPDTEKVLKPNERNAVSMGAQSSPSAVANDSLKKSGSAPSIPAALGANGSSITPTTTPASPNPRAGYTPPILNPTPADSVPFSSPFPFTRRSEVDPAPAQDGVDGAAARAKNAISSLRQFVVPSAEHFRLILMAQILLYSQRQLKSSSLLPPFKLPQSSHHPVNELVLSPKQMEADRNVLLLSFPHLEYLLDVQSREAIQDPALFLGKVENILDAINIFDTRKRPVIGHRPKI